MAVAAMGTKLKIANGYVAELTDIGGLDLSADTLETTNLDSGGWREYTGGMKDGGEVSISGHFNPGDTDGQKALYDALLSGAKQQFLIEFPAALGAKWDFDGVVTKYTTGSAMEEIITFEATIKVSGAPSLVLT